MQLANYNLKPTLSLTVTRISAEPDPNPNPKHSQIALSILEIAQNKCDASFFYMWENDQKFLVILNDADDADNMDNDK